MPYNIIIGRDEADKKRFKEKGLIYLGKGYVKMGNYTSLSNLIWMDVARSHVILVAGKRGSGKCLHGDTLITLGDGTQIPIKELENNKEKVLSMNNKFKIESSEKQEFFERDVSKILKIRLRSGKEIKLTPEHPLFTIKGWIPAQELRVGNRIATPRKTCFGNNELPEHEIKLLAYLIAEGHTKSVVLFSNSDEKIVREFEDSLNKFDPSLKLIKEKEYHYRISSPNWSTKILEHNLNRDSLGHFKKGYANKVQKRSIRELIERENLFGKLSIQKYLSQNIMRLKKENLSLFLNRLFSCDGSIYCKKTNTGRTWQISYSSSSEKLIRQVQSLLLKFGIISKLRYKKVKCNNKLFDSFELILNAENVIKFIEEIGFFGKKQEREFEAKQHILSVKRDTNVDTIPKEIWETFHPQNWAEIGRAFHYKYAKAMRESIDYCPSRQKLLKISEIEQSNPLYLLANSDLFWDEIVFMEILEGNFKVYDISVPENHNFIANDIIVHNSYTIGVLAEELSDLPKEAKENIASLIFDTMGIFWTMKFKNEKEKALLSEWKLKPKNLPVRIFVPYGKFSEYEASQIPVDKKFALKASELEIEDWLLTFNLGIIDPVSVLIEKIITRLKENKTSFCIKDILAEVENSKEKEETKKAASALFEAASTWGIFAEKEKGTEISELIEAGKTTILDLSCYSSVSVFNVRALVIGLVSRKLFTERMSARKKEEISSIHGREEKKEMPLVWIFLDEGHEFLPQEGKTPATDALIQLLREGRQPGISLVLATQQPGAIHRDVMTQSDIIIAHRLTNQKDLQALNEMMQSYLLENINKSMANLPDLKGSAIILDDNSERLYPIRVRPKFTWHGGESPSAVKEEKKI